MPRKFKLAGRNANKFFPTPKMTQVGCSKYDKILHMPKMSYLTAKI